MSKLLVIGLLLLALAACSNVSMVSPVEYFKYVSNPENGLFHSKEFDKVGYELRYRTAEELAFSESRSENGKGFDSLAKGYSGAYYFQFKIKTVNKYKEDPTRYGVKDFEDFQYRIDKFSFRMKDNFYLVNTANGDTIKPINYHFERTYNVSDNSVFSMAFKKLPDGKEKNAFRFVFVDDIFETGPVIFELEKKDLDKAPIIKL